MVRLIADLHSPYLDWRSDLETIEVAREHANEASRLPEHLARADHNQPHDQDSQARNHECTDYRWTYSFAHGLLMSASTSISLRSRGPLKPRAWTL